MPSLSPSLKKGLNTKVIGQTIHLFREIHSTNDLAKELALIGAREGTVIIAETQTRGKGRLGREWISPSGGLWFSIILRPQVNSEDAPELTLLAAVAVAKALGKLYHLKPEVKWPNDVSINGKKVCGILTEANTKGRNLNFVVIGFGINANFFLSILPVSLRGSATTLLEELGKEVNIEALLHCVLEQIEDYYMIFSEGRFDTILSEWRHLAKFLGSYVHVKSLDEEIEGWATDVDDQGALIVKLRDQSLRRVLTGDVTLLK